MTRRKRAVSTVSPVKLDLTAGEIDDLAALAGYYERSMGMMRHVVRFTSPGPIRRRFQFVAEESRWLRAFAESLQSAPAESRREVEFTPRALVAFWGRALSSLQSKRSRRRMSPGAIAARQVLSDKLGRAAAELWLRDPATLSREVGTRRAPEAEWMRRQIEGENS